MIAGDLHLALVTAPPESSRITAAAFAQTHLYAALPQTHAAAQKEDIAFQDLAKDEWILFARRSHPVVRDAIMDAAQRQGIAPKHAHDILTAQEAIHLVSQHVGVAILTKPDSVGLSAEGVVIRPLSDPSLSFETCLIMKPTMIRVWQTSSVAPSSADVHPSACHQSKWNFGCHSLSCRLENGSWSGVAIDSTESPRRLRHIVSLSVTH